MRFRSRSGVTVLAAAMLLLATACGGTSAGDGGTSSPGPTSAGPGSTGPGSSTAPSTSPAPTASATEAPEDLPVPSSSGGKGARPVTLRGTVEPGVEAGCLLLEGYLLIGGPRDVLQAGRTVSVTGRLSPGLATTCQQGTALQVDHAAPAD